MLVYCPECEIKISHTANPCPHCGLERAGTISKEYIEKLYNDLKSYQGKILLIKQQVDSCNKCGERSPHILIGVKIVERCKDPLCTNPYGLGYTIIKKILACPTCRKIEEFHADEEDLMELIKNNPYPLRF